MCVIQFDMINLWEYIKAHVIDVLGNNIIICQLFLKQAKWRVLLHAAYFYLLVKCFIIVWRI